MGRRTAEARPVAFLRHPLRLALGAALLVAAAAPAARGEPAPPPVVVDPLPLRALLAARDFDGLEARFAAARAARDAQELTALLDALDPLGAAEHAGLVAWAQERAGSLAARLALAQRELDLAWEARGGGPARTVGSESRRAMRAHLERSLGHAAAVIDRDPRWLDAYRIQIGCAQLLGDGALARSAFEAALAVDSSHFGVWSRYQSLFQRRWGGSYEAQEQIAQAAQEYADVNPRLRLLLGRADRDRARDLWGARRHAEALAAFDRALRHGDDGPLRADRAALRRVLGDRAGAQAEVEAGLAIDPHDEELYTEQYWLCQEGRDFACMLAASTHLLDLTPADEDARRRHDFAVWAVENPLLAKRALERSPLQRFLHRHGHLAYRHALQGAVGAALLGVGWTVWRARRRRQDEDAAEAPITRAPRAPSAPLAGMAARPSIVERLPRTGVLMVRAYVWFQVVYHVLCYSEMARPTANLRVLGADAAISMAALVGALGFAHGIRLGRAWPWKVWAFAFPIWNQVVATHFMGFGWAHWPVWGFTHLELLPVYTALFLYGFRCDALWAGGVPGPGWAPRRRAPAPTPARPARG